jgi:hypothetical protein
MKTPSPALKKLARQNVGPGSGKKVECWFETMPITLVSAGAAADGTALVEVDWRGTLTKAAITSTYTPVVGHIVLVLVQANQLTIISRVIGTPPAT